MAVPAWNARVCRSSPESDALAGVDDWRERWQAGEVELDALPSDDWSVYEWLHFLSGLDGALDADTMAMMDTQFELTDSGNVEILYLWLQRSIEAEYQPGVQRLEQFLLEVGRNKFTRPLYAALAESGLGPRMGDRNLSARTPRLPTPSRARPPNGRSALNENTVPGFRIPGVRKNPNPEPFPCPVELRRRQPDIIGTKSILFW